MLARAPKSFTWSRLAFDPIPPVPGTTMQVGDRNAQDEIPSDQVDETVRKTIDPMSDVFRGDTQAIVQGTW